MASSTRPKVDAHSEKGIMIKYENRNVRPILSHIIEKLTPKHVYGLSLVNCQLTDTEAKPLAEALRKSKHVNWIDLSRNHFSALGKAEFIKIIDGEPEIKRCINLSDNKPGAQDTLRIVKEIQQRLVDHAMERAAVAKVLRDLTAAVEAKVEEDDNDEYVKVDLDQEEAEKSRRNVVEPLPQLVRLR